jgi:hypothetical protein
MWWNDYWPAWMFIRPIMMLVLVMICIMGTFLLTMRMGPMRHSSDQTGRARTGIALGSLGRYVNTPRLGGRSPALGEYREETLQRLTQEHREFQELIDRLRRNDGQHARWGNVRESVANDVNAVNQYANVM